MRIKHLYLMQEKLLDRIVREKGLERAHLLDHDVLALAVEVAETANCWAQFKYWKEHRDIDRGRLLEEFVDCLHILLSIGLLIGFDIHTDFVVHGDTGRDGVARFQDMLKLVLQLPRNENYYHYTVCKFIDLSLFLGFTWEEVEMAYVRKNRVNHERQASGY